MIPNVNQMVPNGGSSGGGGGGGIPLAGSNLTYYVAILAGTIVGGSGYVSATYTAVPLTGGSGSGGAADIVVSGGVVTQVKPSAGSGYVISDVLSASNSNLGGSGSGFTFTLTGIGSDSNTGLSAAAPFLTIQHGLDTLAGFDYELKYDGLVKLLPGVYNNTNQNWGSGPRANPLINALTNSAASLYFSSNGAIIGDLTTPSNCVVDLSSNTASIDTVGENMIWGIDGLHCKINTTMIQTVSGSVLGGSNFEIELVSGAGNGVAIFFFGAGAFLSWGSGNTTISGSCSPGDFSALINGAGPGISGDSAVTIFFSFLIINTIGNLDFSTGAMFQISDRCAATIITGNITNPGKIVGPGYQITNYSSMQTDVDPPSFPGTGGMIDVSSVWSNVNTNNGLYGFTVDQNSGPPQTTSLVETGYNLFKDTIGGQRYIAFNDGDSIYVKQIGRTINGQSGTTYTIALTDQDGVVRMTNAGANTVTVPLDSSFSPAAPPVGTEVRVTQAGVGATTIAGAVGVTVNNAGALGGQWKSVILRKVAASTWDQTSV